MQKRGQFYLLTALILCLVTFTAIKAAHKTEYNHDERFNELIENFVIEAPRVINYAAYSGYDINHTFSSFEEDFYSYVNSLNAKIWMIYVIHDHDKIMVKNSYNDTVTVNQNTVNAGETYQTQESQLTISLNERDYHFNITSEPVELKVLFIKKE